MITRIHIGPERFEISDEYAWLATSDQDGAIVTFTGKVRNLDNQTEALVLEHYAGMAESMLNQIIENARAKWQIHKVSVIHRVGEMAANEEIVFVGVSSQHRTDAFAAAEFIMDFLKINAPFWKKEKNAQGLQWVAAKEQDQALAKRWK